MTAYDVAAWTLAYPEFPRNRVGPQLAIGVPPYFGGLLRLCDPLGDHHHHHQRRQRQFH